jgi:hypothetical protein
MALGSLPRALKAPPIAVNRGLPFNPVLLNKAMSSAVWACALPMAKVQANIILILFMFHFVF